MDNNDRRKRKIIEHVAKIIILVGNVEAEYGQRKALQEGDGKTAEKYGDAKVITKNLYDNFDTYSVLIENLHNEYKRRE